MCLVCVVMYVFVRVVCMSGEGAACVCSCVYTVPILQNLSYAKCSLSFECAYVKWPL